MVSILPHHEPLRAQFGRARAHGRCTAAYLVVAGAAADPASALDGIAAVLHCAAPREWPCAACGPCLRLAAGTFPDHHILTGEQADGPIPIGAVRAVLRRIALKPFESDRHTVAVVGAEQLTDEAANAMLKSLEEPTGACVWLLACADPGRCLPTITSRCTLVRLAAAPLHWTAALLAEQLGVDDADAQILAAFTSGDRGRAQALHAAGWLRAKNHWIDAHRSGDMLGEPSREEARTALETLVAWYQDVLALQSDRADRVVHRDRLDAARAVAAHLSPSEVADQLRTLLDHLRWLEQHVNPKLAALHLQEHWRLAQSDD